MKIEKKEILEDIGLVIVSPLRRALETCHFLFYDENLLKAPKVIVDPLFTE